MVYCIIGFRDRENGMEKPNNVTMALHNIFLSMIPFSGKII